jgi:hypothetical protein
VPEHPDAVEREAQAVGFGDEPLGRLVERLLGEVERAPVDGHEVLAAHVGEACKASSGVVWLARMMIAGT